MMKSFKFVRFIGHFLAAPLALLVAQGVQAQSIGISGAPSVAEMPGSGDTARLRFEVVGSGTAPGEDVVVQCAVGPTASQTDNDAEASDFRNFADTVARGAYPTQQLTFEPAGWSTAQNCDFFAFDDTHAESSETFTVTLSLLEGTPTISTAIATGTILQSDLVVGFEQSTYRIGESAGTQQICIVNDQRLEPGTLGIDDFQLAYSTMAGTATGGGTDYNDIAQTLTDPFTVTNRRHCFDLTLVDDAAAEGMEDFTLSLTAMPGETLEGVTLVPATVNIVDGEITVDIANAGADADAAADGFQVQEGDTALFRVTLDAPAAGGITITYAVSGLASSEFNDQTGATNNMLSFAAGATEALISIDLAAAVDDTNNTLTVTISLPDPVADGNLADAVSLGTASAEAFAVGRSVAVVLSPGALTVSEGGTVTYSVTLNTAPAMNMDVVITPSSSDTAVLTVPATALTFTSSTWSTAQMVTVTGVTDTDNTDGTASVTHDVAQSGGPYHMLAGVEVAVTVRDNLMISTRALSVTEGQTATYSVVLGVEPMGGEVIVTPSASGVTLTPDALTFDSSTWSDSQEVTVEAGEDDADYEDQTVTVSHAVSGTATNYAGAGADDVVVTLQDDDTDLVPYFGSGVSVPNYVFFENTADTLLLPRAGGGNGALSYTLTGLPDNTGLTFSADDFTLSGTPAMTFAATTLTWSATDSDVNAPDSAILTFTLQVDAPTTVRIGFLRNRHEFVEDTRATPAVFLQTMGAFDGEVHVLVEFVARSPDDFNTPPGFFTEIERRVVRFTGTGVPLVAIDFGIVDNNLIANRERTLTAVSSLFAVSRGIEIEPNDFPTTQVAVLDNEFLRFFFADESPSGGTGNFSLSAREGETSTYTVRLGLGLEADYGDFTVQLTAPDGSDASLNFSPAALTFSPGNALTPQTVSLRGVEDDDDTNNDIVTVRHTTLPSLPGGVVDMRDLLVTIRDNDVPEFFVSPTALTVTEGRSAPYTVRLQIAPTDDVTVQPSSQGISASFNPASLTFTASNWNTPQNVTMSAAEETGADANTATDNGTITHSVTTTSNYQGESVPNLPVTVLDNDVPGIFISPESLSIVEGGSQDILVRLQVAPDAQTVLVPSAVSSGTDLVFSPGNLTFSTMNWNTAQTVSVSAPLDTDVDDGTATLRYAANNASGNYMGVAVSVPVAVTDLGYPVNIGFARATYLEREDVGLFQVCVEMTVPTTTPALPASASARISLSAAVGDGDSAEASDFALDDPDAILMFTDANRRACALVGLTGDAIPEESETFTLTLAVVDEADSLLSVTLSRATAPVTIEDDDPVVVTFGATAYAAVEGETLAFTVTVDSPGADVAIERGDFSVAVSTTAGTATAGSDFTALSNASVGPFSDATRTYSVNLNIIDDADQETAETLTLDLAFVAGQPSPVNTRIGPASGSGTSQSVTVTIDASDIPGLIVMPPSLIMNEGESANFRLNLQAQPDMQTVLTPTVLPNDSATLSPSMLTFSATNWNTPQTVSVRAAVDDDAEDHTITLSYASNNPSGNYMGLVQSLRVSVVDRLSAPNFGRATVADQFFPVGGEIAALTLPLAVDGDAPVTYSLQPDIAGLTFNPSNRVWSGTPSAATASPVTLTYTATDSDGSVDSLTFSASVYQVAVGFEMAAYTRREDVGAFEVCVVITAPAADIPLPAGNSARVTVSPSLRPGDSAEELDFTTGSTVVVFDHGSRNRCALITIIDDQVREDSETFSLTLSVDEAASDFDVDLSPDTGTASVTIEDNDTILMRFDTTAYTTMEGTSVTFTVVMADPPADQAIERGDFSLSLSTVDGTAVAGMDFDALTNQVIGPFGNSNRSHTVTLDIIDDYNEEADETFSVRLGFVPGQPEPANVHIGSSSGTSQSATVTIPLNDVPGVTITPTALTVDEGEYASYTAVLEAFPTVDITLTPSSSEPLAAADSGALTFTGSNWNTAQTVTVSAPPDFDAADHTVTLSHAVSGGGNYIALTSADNVVVSVIDDDMTGITVTPTTLTLIEGAAANYTVYLHSQPARGGSVTITPSSSNREVATVEPAEGLTFGAANWNVAQTVTVTGVDDMDDDVSGATITHAVAGADYGGVEAEAVNITVDEMVTDELQALNEVILPELARAVVVHQLDAITERAAVAGNPVIAPSFNLGGQSSFAGVAAANAKTLAGDDVNMKEMLRDMDFVMPLSANAGPASGGGGGMAFWGGSEYRDFSGEDGDTEWDGDQFSLHLGVDTRMRRNLLAGLMLSYTDSQSEYSYVEDATTKTGEYELDITSLSPYLNWYLPGGGTVWFSLGYGEGDLDITPDDDAMAASSSDVNMRSLGGGGSRQLLKQGRNELHLKADVFLTQAEIEGNDVNINQLEVDAHRLRIAVESRHPRRLSNGMHLTPAFEIGVRRDGGDGQTGQGVEVGGSVLYRDAPLGLTLEARARALLGHSGDQRGWGIGGFVRVESGRDGQGLSLSLNPNYGNTEDDSEKLWQDGVRNQADKQDLEARLNARVGYGVPARLWLPVEGRGMLTPYSALSWAQNKQKYSLGVQWETTQNFDLDLSAKRVDKEDKASDHGLILQGKLSF